MSVTDEMAIAERRKYLDKMQKRYKKAKRKEKGRLLDEMEAVTGQHRKGLIRLLNGSLERQPRSRERGRVYGPAEAAVVGVVAEKPGLGVCGAIDAQPGLAGRASGGAWGAMANGSCKGKTANRQHLDGAASAGRHAA
jgi:hypothetical protein